MQETRYNYFGLKIRSTTIRQAKTIKHECRNVTATYISYTRAYLFSSRNNCFEFLGCYGVTFKVLLIHILKHQFLVVQCRIYPPFLNSSFITMNDPTQYSYICNIRFITFKMTYQVLTIIFSFEILHDWNIN